MPIYDAKPQLLSIWICDNHTRYMCYNSNLTLMIQYNVSNHKFQNLPETNSLTHLLFTTKLATKLHFATHRSTNTLYLHIKSIIHFFIFCPKYYFCLLYLWQLPFNKLFVCFGHLILFPSESLINNKFNWDYVETFNQFSFKNRLFFNI